MVDTPEQKPKQFGIGKGNSSLVIQDRYHRRVENANNQDGKAVHLA